MEVAAERVFCKAPEAVASITLDDEPAQELNDIAPDLFPNEWFPFACQISTWQCQGRTAKIYATFGLKKYCNCLREALPFVVEVTKHPLFSVLGIPFGTP